MSDQMAAVLARLDRAEAVLAIMKLSADYCRGADRRELDTFMSVWAVNGAWQVRSDLEFRGHDEIARGIQTQWDSITRAVHMTSNASIDVEGNAGIGVFDVAAEVELPGGELLSVSGQYHDNYVREHGQWRIARRSATVDRQRVLPAS